MEKYPEMIAIAEAKEKRSKSAYPIRNSIRKIRNFLEMSCWKYLQNSKR